MVNKMAKNNKKYKRRQKAVQQNAARRKKNKMHQTQKADLATYISNVAANAAAAGLIGIAVTKGDNIGINVGLGLLALSLSLQLLSLIIKRL